MDQMAEFQPYEYMEDYDVDFDENAEYRFQVPRERVASDSDSEDDDDDDELSQVTDTTTQQARKGKDIQGIPWERLQFTREKYRETRLQQYENYESLVYSHEELNKECKEFKKGGRFYDFRLNTRSVKPTIVHFQLRNLVWATSKHDVYVMHSFSILHWSPLTRKSTEILNAGGPVVPSSEVERNPWTYQQGLGRIQINTMCVKDNLVHLRRPGVSYCAKITRDENAITNAIEIYDSLSGAKRLMTSNNDSVVRIFDIQNFAVLGRYSFDWPVNHTSVSPDSKMVVVLGDNADGILADSQNGKVIATLKGHLDYSFASAWHPDGRIFATGNQDATCRLWDVRNLSTAVTVLKGHIGAIRSIRFSSDGRFMAMAEPADFVHVFNTQYDYGHCQEIDLFGEIAGISFSPDTEALFIGVTDRTYGSLLEYNRRHVNWYLDSLY